MVSRDCRVPAAPTKMLQNSPLPSTTACRIMEGQPASAVEVVCVMLLWAMNGNMEATYYTHTLWQPAHIVCQNVLPCPLILSALGKCMTSDKSLLSTIQKSDTQRHTVIMLTTPNNCSCTPNWSPGYTRLWRSFLTEEDKGGSLIHSYPSRVRNNYLTLDTLKSLINLVSVQVETSASSIHFFDVLPEKSVKQSSLIFHNYYVYKTILS